MSIIIKNIKTVVVIENTKIIQILRKEHNREARRKIIRDFLNNNLSNRPINKTFFNMLLKIVNTKTDTGHLTRNEHIDTTIALTQVEELIISSTYISETATDFKQKPNSPNDYFWFFKTIMELDGIEYEYVLNIARSKTDGHICLYDITNYNKKNADSYQVSNLGNNTFLPTSIIENNETKVNK